MPGLSNLTTLQLRKTDIDSSLSDYEDHNSSHRSKSFY